SSRKAYLRATEAASGRPDMGVARIAGVVEVLAAGVKHRPRWRARQSASGHAGTGAADPGDELACGRADRAFGPPGEREPGTRLGPGEPDGVQPVCPGIGERPRDDGGPEPVRGKLGQHPRVLALERD